MDVFLLIPCYKLKQPSRHSLPASLLKLPAIAQKTEMLMTRKGVQWKNRGQSMGMEAKNQQLGKMLANVLFGEG